jgi:hypothetical protein
MLMCCAPNRSFLLAAEQGADLLLSVKNNQRQPYRQLESQFRGNRHFPLVISDCEAGHCLQLRWTPRARNATDVIRERWAGPSWFIELVSNSLRWTGFSGQAPSLASEAGYRH